MAFNAMDQVASTTAPAVGGARQVTLNYSDQMGRVTNVINPDLTVVANWYLPNGLLARTAGSRTYPAAYGYDAQGRMRYMT